ncbi:MFS transporter [Shewanella surugensis]|uniref:MFS transporter n=1 Tax=Shewanella surugensis TaxID=212020 RepID=A0ABT0LF04_9GAMM|nr:MFS transporter [Shewanella surugensis]MCL1126278.1 MFS transporter [Shewanella surugensis]
MAIFQSYNRLGFFAMSLAIVVIAYDFTAFSVALPSISDEFNSTLNHSQWIFNGYALTLGVFIITGGHLADLYGRRRLFFIGISIFTVFSIIGASAFSLNMLIFCRIVMGVGAAAMWPAVLGMVYALMPKEKAGFAGGFIIGIAGISNAAGPMIGGILTDFFSWRWILLVNIPVTILAIIFTWKAIVPEVLPLNPKRVDYAGVLTLSVSLFALLMGLDSLAGSKLDSLCIMGLFGVFVVSMLAFIIIERLMRDDALIPKELMKNKEFFAIGMTTLMMSTVFFAALLYLPQFFMRELGYSAAESGVGLLPMILTYAGLSFVSGMLYQRFGARLIVSVGVSLLACGMLLLSNLQVSTPYWQLAVVMLILGGGIGLAYPTVTTAAMMVVPSSRMSLAGGIIYMFRSAGGAIGIGISTCIILLSSSPLIGMKWAFLFNAILAFLGLLISLCFITGHLKKY